MKILLSALVSMALICASYAAGYRKGSDEIKTCIATIQRVGLINADLRGQLKK